MSLVKQAFGILDPLSWAVSGAKTLFTLGQVPVYRNGGPIRYFSKIRPNSFREKGLPTAYSSLARHFSNVRDKGKVFDTSRTTRSFAEALSGGVGTATFPNVDETVNKLKNSRIGKMTLDVSKRWIDEGGNFNIKNIDSDTKTLLKFDNYVKPIVKNQKLIVPISVGAGATIGALNGNKKEVTVNEYGQYIQKPKGVFKGAIKGALTGLMIGKPAELGIKAYKNVAGDLVNLSGGYQKNKQYFDKIFEKANKSKAGKMIADFYSDDKDAVITRLAQRDASEFKNYQKVQHVVKNISDLKKYIKTGMGTNDPKYKSFKLYK